MKHVEHVLLVPHCGPGIGLGHHERMLALGEALSRLNVGTTLSVPAGHRPSLERARARGIRVAPGALDPCRRALSAVATQGASACVLDGYVFIPAVQRQLRSMCPVVVVDDLGAAADCDLSVNPSLAPVPAPAGARAHLGAPHHTLLSAADDRAREHRAARAPVRPTILVSVGGSDLGGLATDLAVAIAATGCVAEIVIVTGPETVARPLPAGIRVAYQPASLSDLLSEAALYVGTAGVTAVQAACIGVPMVAIAAVDNQRPQTRALAASGCAVVVEDVLRIPSEVVSLLDDPARRERMSRAGRALVDSGGAQRVATAVAALVHEEPTAARMVSR